MSTLDTVLEHVITMKAQVARIEEQVGDIPALREQVNKLRSDIDPVLARRAKMIKSRLDRRGYIEFGMFTLLGSTIGAWIFEHATAVAAQLSKGMPGH